MKRVLLLTLLTSVATFATPLLLPNITVLGTDSADGVGFDAGGPTFTVVGNFLSTDTLSLIVSGTVDLANGGFTANAAGIITAPATTNTGAHPGQTSPNADNASFDYAALLIGNSTLGFHQVFLASAANGLGSSTPPTTLFLPATTLGALGFASGLSNGTVLEFRVSDINSGDNSGAFNISQAPEPGTFSLLALGLCGAAFAMRRRARA